jgi:tRNA G10  N-methylase Trm11
LIIYVFGGFSYIFFRDLKDNDFVFEYYYPFRMIKRYNCVMKTYKLKFLSGTLEFVVKEIKEKFPEVEIVKEDKEELQFESTEEIEVFRKLLSPTHISDGKKVLNLAKHEWRKGYIPAGINPSLAYVMCMIADFSPENILYDPFCGSSVIPIIALKHFNIKRAICSDISGNAISQSKINFENAKIEENRYKLFKSDIKNVTLNKKNVDRIVSNLPFGIRTGSHEGNIGIYTDLERLADRLLRTKGKLVLLTQEKILLRKVFNKEKWNVKSVTTVNQGGLKPDIFLIERKATP